MLGSSRVTVADRVQKFRNASQTKPQSVTAPHNRRIETASDGFRGQSGWGHRKEGSFGPPAGRTSRDGVDGTRGDGRPPVGSPYPSEQPSPYLSPRPAISLTKDAHQPEDPFLMSGAKVRSPRKYRSMEKIAEAPTEIATARSRLKSTVKKVSSKASPETQCTIEELGDMIDTAIEEQTSEVETKEPEQVGVVASPERTVIRRWRSRRPSRKSLKDVDFQTSPEQSPERRSSSRPTNMHRVQSARKESSPGKGVEKRFATDSDLIPTSPVKFRAAVFETLQEGSEHPKGDQGKPASGPHLHMKRDWSIIPVHEFTAEKERDLHRMKFGETIYERSESSEMDIKVPEQTRDRAHSTDASHETNQSFETAKQTPPQAESTEDEIRASRNPEINRQTTLIWPFKWGPFKKSSAVPPQQNEVDITATLQKDEHHLPSRPSIVRHKVQELLKRDEEEQGRRRSELAYKKKAQSDPPSTVTTGDLREAGSNTPKVKPAQMPPLQLPEDYESEKTRPSLESTEPRYSVAAGIVTPGEVKVQSPNTPSYRSWAEKEVLNATKLQASPGSARSNSPAKPAASNLVRGRSINDRRSMPGKNSTHTSEQAYVFSPIPSRSQSRARSPVRVHKFEVEMRDSPEREAREKGEKIMFVRTYAFEEDTE